MTIITKDDLLKFLRAAINASDFQDQLKFLENIDISTDEIHFKFNIAKTENYHDNRSDIAISIDSMYYEAYLPLNKVPYEVTLYADINFTTRIKKGQGIIEEFYIIERLALGYEDNL